MFNNLVVDVDCGSGSEINDQLFLLLLAKIGVCVPNFPNVVFLVTSIMAFRYSL